MIEELILRGNTQIMNKNGQYALIDLGQNNVFFGFPEELTKHYAGNQKYHTPSHLKISNALIIRRESNDLFKASLNLTDIIADKDMKIVVYRVNDEIYVPLNKAMIVPYAIDDMISRIGNNDTQITNWLDTLNDKYRELKKTEKEATLK